MNLFKVVVGLSAGVFVVSHSLSAEIKTALVIGNNSYQLAALENSVKDANAISKELKALGFAVELVTNAPYSLMAARFDAFAKKVSGVNGVVAVVYYSGHGMQRDDRNLLLGIDVKHDTIDESSIDMQKFLSSIRPASDSTYLVILDACRQYAKGLEKQGLAPLDAPPGTLIAYSTAPGRLASDGDPKDGNGVYTKYLIKHLKTPGLPVESVFKKIRASVLTETKGDQVPWENSSMLRDLYFVGAPVGSLARQPITSAKEIALEKKGGATSRLSALYEVLTALQGKPFVSPDDIEALNAIFKPAYGIEVKADEARFMSKYLLSIGVGTQDIPGFVREKYGITPGFGVMVLQSDGSGFAETVGILNGDLILKINDKEVRSGDDFKDVLQLQSRKPGEILSLTVLREGQQIGRSAVLERSAADTLMLQLVNEKWRQKDHVRLRALLEGLASKNNARAMGLLAKFYFENGEGFEGSKFDLAFDYAKKSAALGDFHGKAMVSQAYESGRGTDTNRGKAIELLNRFAEEGENWAIGMLATRYSKGEGVERNYEKARKYAERGAFMGDHNAAFAMGRIYSEGLGVSKSNEEAIKWFQRTLEIIRLYQGDTKQYQEVIERGIKSLSSR